MAPWRYIEQSFPISHSSFLQDILMYVCVGGGLFSSCCISVRCFGERDEVASVVFIIHPKISFISVQSPSTVASFFRLMESFSSPSTVG